MYLVVLTRPDIAYAVSYLSQFNHCNTELQWHFATRILRYLNCTKNLGLKYNKGKYINIEGYVDADWCMVKKTQGVVTLESVSSAIIKHAMGKNTQKEGNSKPGSYRLAAKSTSKTSRILPLHVVPYLRSCDRKSLDELCECTQRRWRMRTPSPSSRDGAPASVELRTSHPSSSSDYSQDGCGGSAIASALDLAVPSVSVNKALESNSPLRQDRSPKAE